MERGNNMVNKAVLNVKRDMTFSVNEEHIHCHVWSCFQTETTEAEPAKNLNFKYRKQRNNTDFSIIA